MAINPGINPNNLQIGQVICIPSTNRDHVQQESHITPPRKQCPTGNKVIDQELILIIYKSRSDLYP